MAIFLPAGALEYAKVYKRHVFLLYFILIYMSCVRICLLSARSHHIRENITKNNYFQSFTIIIIIIRARALSYLVTAGDLALFIFMWYGWVVARHIVYMMYRCWYERKKKSLRQHKLHLINERSRSGHTKYCTKRKFITLYFIWK